MVCRPITVTIVYVILCMLGWTTGNLDYPKTVAKSGTNISLACGGVSSSSYIYLIEWVCQGCDCGQCPSHSNNGLRLLRYNDKITQWDNSFRRTLDKHRYGLEFAPVTVEDTGVYYCLINNQPDLSPVQLIVQDAPEAPSNRPMISSITSRSVLLTWATPLNDNHDPIINYRIFTREDNVLESTKIDTGVNETRFLVTGLKPFTTYSFKVSAENKIGYSVPSKESFQTQTHRERPSVAPVFRRSKITTHSTGLDVYWDPPPISTINGEFLGYILTYRPAERYDKKVIEVRDESLKTQNYSLNGLLRHTNYIVTLAAKNLEGMGPEAAIELRTEDGVPLQPQDFTIREVSSTEVDITWRPPSNADILGSQLLGYRVYIRDIQCQGRGEPCQDSQKKTISDPTATHARIGLLKPATPYELSVLGFTPKREGVKTDVAQVTTDTAKPSPPIITNVNCTGNGDILVEWRRSRVIYGRIDFFIVYYKSRLDHTYFKRKIEVGSKNSSDLYLTQLTSLKNFTTYNLAVSAITVSNRYPGKLYESQLSSYHQVFVSPLCDVGAEMVSFNRDGLSTVMIAIVLAIVTSIILILAIALCCRRSGRRYELVSVLSPTKYLQCAGLVPSRGWTGEPASDIPASLFPKHVQGLHASGNMAFVKGFQAFPPHNTDYRGKANSFADVGDGGSCDSYGPVTIDSWRCPCAYVCMVGDSLISNWRAWRNIWENQIELVVTFPQEMSKDDLAHFSTSKYVGSYQIQVEREAVLAAYTARTFKVQHAASTRTVTQLVFNTWPDVGPPENSSFVQFVCEAFSLRQSLQGKVLVYSRSGLDPAIYFMCLDTMLGQMRDTGDTNLSNYIKHLSSRHGLGLSSTELYVDLHDTLAWAIQGGVSAHIQRRIGVSRAV
eukprot:TRINITY_DN8764_c0_g1_i1.p1 TRINITY_DN8764_c0_g1~~TRINITY_DN8764_c0_g1_i1.p1  ORF type:complete len:894 (-),score=170.55 TRINITY_DN8764_c0_g1_i1:336-3017(-)